MTINHTTSKRSLLILAVILLPIIGYALMRLMPEAFNNDGDATGTHVIVYIALIAVALTVPYLMLKSGMKSAHLGDAREPELVLKDIPKDKEQISRKS